MDIQGGGISLLSDWFPYYGFHLALFAFGSGYFYKSKSEEHVGTYILKKVKDLIIPLYIYNFIYGMITQILKLNGFGIGGDFTLYNVVIAPITNGHQFEYNMGGWFVIPLFMVEIYNISVRKLIKIINKNVHEIVFFTINLILGLIGNQLACEGDMLYHNNISNCLLVWVRMLYFVPFFGLGILYKSILEKYDRKFSNFWYLVIIFTINLLIIYHFGKTLAYTPSWCNDFAEGPIMPIVIGVLGIALWMRIATIIEPIVGKSKWINLIADNTYSIMMNQFLGFMIVKTIYALVSKMNLGFSDFDLNNYKTNIWYYYQPKGLKHTLIIYVVVGIAFSIVVQKIIDVVRNKIRKAKLENYSYFAY